MGINTPVFIDVNKDGFLDLVMQFNAGIYLKDIGNIDRPVEIRVFINHEGKYFTDETSYYINGSNRLESVSTYPVVYDFNNDGIPDIIYAPNKIEGGAIVSNPAFDSYDYFSKLKGFISDGKSYSVVDFGTPRFWGTISVVKVDGVAYVVGSGDLPIFDIQYAYRFEDGNFVESDIGLPVLRRAFQIINDENGNARYIVQQSEKTQNLVSYQRGEDGSWVKVSDLGEFFRPVADIKVNPVAGEPYTARVVYLGDKDQFGDLEASYSVGGVWIKLPMTSNPLGYYAIEPSYITGAIYSERDGAQKYVIVKAELLVIPNYEIGKTNEVSADISVIGATQNLNKLIFIRIGEDGSIHYESAKIYGEKNTWANNITIYDINRDGLNDIVVHDFNGIGVPIIYLSEGGLNFRLYEPEGFNLEKNYVMGSSGWVADFNNDDYFDIISIPSLGQDRNLGVSLENILYYTSSTSGHFG